MLASQARLIACSAEYDGYKRLGVIAQLGPRPYFLVDDMAKSPLKAKLKACIDRPAAMRRTPFSIGHRGACMQFPEHTLESYVAAARMGAGIIECDVTFTKGKQLVCRHSQNDLHTTTNILVTELAEKCIKPFKPAAFDADGKLMTPATAECRTSELTLEEFKSIKGKMDASNPAPAPSRSILAVAPTGAPTSTPAPPAGH